jgi:hypothetical protein
MSRRDFAAFIIVGMPAHLEVARLGEGIQKGFIKRPGIYLASLAINGKQRQTVKVIIN